jgi:hypothetical protein
MKLLSRLFCIALLTLTASCASTGKTRIQQDQARFDSYTPAERRLIRMGEVAVGFDENQVSMALGQPDRTTTVETSNGTSIAWEYLELDPTLGFSLGGILGSGGQRAIGTGVNVQTNSKSRRLTQLVIFDQQTGKVRKVETYN